MNYLKNPHFIKPQFLKKSFWLPHIALPLFAGLALIFVYPHTHLDFWLIQAFFDSHAHAFPLRDSRFIENIMHKGLKNLIIIIGLTIFTLWLSGLNVTTKSVTYLNQKKWITVYHQQFLWLFIAMITSTAIISFLKHLSIHSCPWSLTEFGGTEPWVPLFGQLPKGAVAGHCFPGGHASGGFALMAIYFAFKDELIKVAKFGLVLGLVLGFIMGWGQMIRGAHFMSHNLWSAWIVWALLLTQYMMWQPKITTQSN